MNAPMNVQKYQPEIDGIRAIAVVAVVLYHAEFRFIPGGFVGVDVFFVISGYLITRLIHRDAVSGSFSFRDFYLRRLRRLGPALLVTIAATFAVALLYLTPDHFQRFAGALMASLLSVSNFFFWAESGYFDASAELKPLLHTWSLSVEEQFYLVWPLLIVLLCRRTRWHLPLAVLLLSLASLAGARLLTTVDPSAAFFLMPFRVFEFGIGAGLALIPGMLLRRQWAYELCCIAGLLLVIYSVLAFDHSTPFPDVYALVPCLGAALLIAGGQARYSGWLLRNPLSVWLGRISYSLYLVHWPVVVLYKHITFEDVIVGKTRIALLVLTLLLAVALFELVEKRYRLAHAEKGAVSRRRQLSWLFVPLGLSIASVHAMTNQGWQGRFDPSVMWAVGNIEQKQLIRRQYIETPDAVSNQPFDVADPVTGTTNVLVMGDSHATDMFNALYLNVAGDTRFSVRRLEIDDVCLYLFSERGQQATELLAPAEAVRCRRQFDAVQRSPMLVAAERIVLSTRWEASSFAYLEDFIRFLTFPHDSAVPPVVIVMGRTGEFKNVPSLILRYGLGEDIRQQLAATRFTGLDTLNASLRELSNELRLVFVDKLPFLCNADMNTETSGCDAVDEQGRVLYTDYGHWTIEGARFFGQRMLGDDAAARALMGLPAAELTGISSDS